MIDYDKFSFVQNFEYMISIVRITIVLLECFFIFELKMQIMFGCLHFAFITVGFANWLQNTQCLVQNKSKNGWILYLVYFGCVMIYFLVHRIFKIVQEEAMKDMIIMSQLNQESNNIINNLDVGLIVEKKDVKNPDSE